MAKRSSAEERDRGRLVLPFERQQVLYQQLRSPVGGTFEQLAQPLHNEALESLVENITAMFN